MNTDYKSEYIDGIWKITELRTGNIMGIFQNQKDCINEMVSLLSGSPFNGWTPAYILVDPKSAIDNTSKMVYTDDIVVED